jgi:hypothetical protein
MSLAPAGRGPPALFLNLFRSRQTPLRSARSPIPRFPKKAPLTPQAGLSPFMRGWGWPIGPRPWFEAPDETIFLNPRSYFPRPRRRPETDPWYYESGINKGDGP